MDKKRGACIIMAVGGYLGDEGKGKITQYYCEEVRRKYKQILCARTTGGTNTGATFFSEKGKKLAVHMLPIGAFIPHCHAYIGTGCYLNTKILLEELRMRREELSDYAEGKIFISKNTHVVIDKYLEEDAKKENTLGLGSTKNGVSIAASNKYNYTGLRVSDIKNDEFLKEAIFKFSVEIVDPFEFFENIVIPNEWGIVIEGTQGAGLDVNHGFDYPFVSAGSFTTHGLLDGVGYSLTPHEICMVLKAYGSYFGPIRMGISDFDDEEFRKYAGEFGTTTGRPRNLCWLRMDLLKRAASLIKPTSIAINCLDKMQWFCQNNKTWKLYLNKDCPIEFEDTPIHKKKLTKVGIFMIEMIEEACNAKVTLVGIGPKHTDVIER